MQAVTLTQNRHTEKKQSVWIVNQDDSVDTMIDHPESLLFVGGFF